MNRVIQNAFVLVLCLCLCTSTQAGVLGDLEGWFVAAGDTIEQNGATIGSQMTVAVGLASDTFVYSFAPTFAPSSQSMDALGASIAQEALNHGGVWAPRVGVLVLYVKNGIFYVLGKVYYAGDRTIDAALDVGEEITGQGNSPQRLASLTTLLRIPDCTPLSVVSSSQGTPHFAIYHVPVPPVATYSQKYYCPNGLIRNAGYNAADTLLFHKYQHRAVCGTNVYGNIYLVWPGHSPPKIGKYGQDTNNCNALSTIIDFELVDTWGQPANSVAYSNFRLQFAAA